MDNSKKSDPDRQILSAATILILSGILIGMAIAQPMDKELSCYVLMCGLSGLLAFLVFEGAAQRRKTKMAEKSSNRMAQRLERHVHSPAPSGGAESPEHLARLLGDVELKATAG